MKLWVPIAVHFLNDGFYSFVSVRTMAGLDENILIMQAVATIDLVTLTLLLPIVAP
ncbi:MAG: hypothetical protein KKE51_12070 [Gammaproteobacteria bacterium]|nr:hypothetical protein [Gammaproteobacteria bacterium]MBU1602031.1 hypothetical protein [Gammaproteobacteria bacterium]MBU2434008.1 hypothetical protein [Gammaproteobacteria bacterium]MBU2447832.1 hypothetical protein [Gammaproteobacteria bacterium]